MDHKSKVAWLAAQPLSVAPEASQTLFLQIAYQITRRSFGFVMDAL